MEGTRQQERIQVELLKHALRLAPIGIVATFVNALVVVLVLWESISHTTLLIWFSLTLCLVVQRFWFLYKYRRGELEPHKVAHIVKIFVASLGLAGMAWGFLGIFLFPLDAPTHQILIVFVLCGMVAGAAETYAPILPAFIAFALPALLPLFIRFLTIGEAIYYAMSAMTLLYIALTLIIAKRINTMNKELIKLKDHYFLMAEERESSNTLLKERTAELSASHLALKEHAEKLEKLNEELQDFAFIASHDLQEPLRKLQTYCDLAISSVASTPDSVRREYLNRIIISASRMRKQVSDLLNYSQATSTPIAFKAVDLSKIARKAADMLENTIKETGGLIEIETMPAIEADEAQMLRLFHNLIGNAIKFRGARPPRIVISAREDEHGICEISVTDNGIGFDPRYAERIFRPFQRLHGLKEYEGTGIGLTICRKIAERHGGSISAFGTPGEGSTFLIRLPVKQDESLT